MSNEELVKFWWRFVSSKMSKCAKNTIFVVALPDHSVGSRSFRVTPARPYNSSMYIVKLLQPWLIETEDNMGVIWGSASAKEVWALQVLRLVFILSCSKNGKKFCLNVIFQFVVYCI